MVHFRAKKMRRGHCGNAEDIEQTQKERKEKAPKSLPRQRPRALTSPLPSPSFQRPPWNPFRRSIPQRTLDQSQTALFGQLPSEIRHIIWTEYMSGHLLHIARDRNRLLAIDCVEKEPEKQKIDAGSESRLYTRFHGCWGGKTGHSTTPGFYFGPRSKNPGLPANLLPLLQTCRRIYTETISMLYANNLFDINHLDTIFYMQQTVLPQRLAQIRMLNFTWDFKYCTAGSYSPVPYDLTTWQEVCETLSIFTGLQELTLHLTGSEIQPFADGGKKWCAPLLEPLKRIKPAKRFDIFVKWTEGSCMEMAKEGYPFRFLPEVVVEPRNDDTIEL